jgi:hypothetical protein
VVGLITDNNETAYRDIIRDLAILCHDNKLSLNVIKTEKMIVDYRKRRTEHIPILVDGAVVEQVESFKILGVHITNMLGLQSQGTTESSVYGPVHHWGQASCRSGPL